MDTERYVRIYRASIYGQSLRFLASFLAGNVTENISQVAAPTRQILLTAVIGWWQGAPVYLQAYQ